jgi:hypothetical protein
MKWLLVMIPFAAHGQPQGPVPSDVVFLDALYGSLQACQSQVEALQKQSSDKDSGIAYCYAVDPTQTLARIVGEFGKQGSGRSSWQPYEALHHYQFK